MIDLSHLGDLQPDGSVRLFDRNIQYRKYRRIRQSTEQEIFLTNRGFTVVQSSNVSALQVVGDDLYIRFLNGSLYRYQGSANIFDKIMGSLSKGSAVWKYLRRPKKPYEKVGKIDFPKDISTAVDEELRSLTDQDIFQSIDAQVILNMTRNIDNAVLQNKVLSVNGIQVVPLVMGKKTIYIPLSLLIVQN
jgi:hypothetical protein